MDVIAFTETPQCLIAHYRDGTEGKFEKPPINVFEHYEVMLCSQKSKRTIVAISNDYNSNLDWVLLKEM